MSTLFLIHISLLNYHSICNVPAPPPSPELKIASKSPQITKKKKSNVYGNYTIFNLRGTLMQNTNS
jgi:hypothetical protein